MKGSKRFGHQSCDNCGREFVVRSSDEWDCPHCGMDNKQGTERARHAARVASQRSKLKRQEK